MGRLEKKNIERKKRINTRKKLSKELNYSRGKQNLEH